MKCWYEGGRGTTGTETTRRACLCGHVCERNKAKQFKAPANMWMDKREREDAGRDGRQ